MPNLKRVYRQILRTPLDMRYRRLLKNTNFTIFSSNCVGGVIYHILNQQFLSPTINEWMHPSDFIRFLTEPNMYFNTKIEPVEDNPCGYPVVKIRDIVVYCTHYKSIDEFEYKWNIRAKRINWNNIYVIMSERDGCTYRDLVAFDNLPYSNKVVFVHKEMPEIASSLYIEGTELDGKDGHYVKPLTDYFGGFSGKRLLDLWDFVSFLNR